MVRAMNPKKDQKGPMSFFLISTWKKQTSMMDSPDFHAVGEFGSHKGSKVRCFTSLREPSMYIIYAGVKTKLIRIPYTSIFYFYYIFT